MIYAFHALTCGFENCLASALDPTEPDAEKRRALPYVFYLLETDRGLVLFDSGPHPDFVRRGTAYIGAAASNWQVRFRPEDDPNARLASLGVDPAQIELVLLSHLHYDHAGGIASFPNATFWIQGVEWDFAHAPSAGQVNAYVPSEFRLSPDRVRLLDGEVDVLGDGSCRLLPTPGHTPGHQSLLLGQGGRHHILAADAAYLSDLDDPRSLPGPAFAWNIAAMAESHRRLRAIRDEFGAVVHATHDPANLNRQAN